jgi:hypothetical protein
MKELIEKLQAAEQNIYGMFEIDEDTICALMDLLTAPPVAWTSQRSLDVRDKITAFTSEESAVDHGNKSAWVNIVPLYQR